MSRLRPFALAVLLSITPLPLAASTVNLPAGMEAGSCVEGICEYRLANGLKVLLFPDASQSRITLNMTYGVGSLHENYGETGMAHLLEHLLFKGTPRHADIPGEMKKRAINYNGTTSSDRTNYFGSFPANAETLDWLIALEADRMLNSHIAKKDLDSEMTVVRNELERGENSPGSLFHQRLQAASYHWHNYGKSTIGNRFDVESVPIENLQAFYRTWYQPDNATLIIAGKFDVDRTLARIQHHFGTLPRPSRQLPVHWTREPAQDGEREINIRRRGDMRLLGISYHTPSITHPDAAPLVMLANILAHTPGGRLHKALVEPKLAAVASSGIDTLRWPGRFILLAMPMQDTPSEQLEAALLKQIEALAEHPITAQELRDAQQRFATGFELSMNNVGGIGMAMSEAVAAGDWRLMFVMRDAVAAVTLEDVNRVANIYFTPSNRTLARFIPTDAPVRVETGPAPSVESLVTGYVGRSAVAAGEAFDPSLENIAARTRIVQLRNGVQVSLLPKKNRGQTVTFNASFDFADLPTYHRYPKGTGNMVGSLLMRGSQRLNREQINAAFIDLKTSANIGGGMQEAHVNLHSQRDNLADALRLAAEILRTPSFPENEFELLRQQSITLLEAARKEPNTLLDAVMGPDFDPWPAGHPFAWQSLDQSLDNIRALRLEDIKAYHRDVYGTGAGQIAVVGDFDPDTLLPLLETLFGDWQSGAPYAEIATRHHPVPARRRQIETPDKANASYVARMNIPLNDDHPDYPALLVANRILGGDGMASRLSVRVRQQEGLSYGISSRLSADSSRSGQDDAGSFHIHASSAPENIAQLERMIDEELRRWVREGITESELAETVNSLLLQRQQGRTSDDTIAAMLNTDRYRGRNIEQRIAFEARLRSLGVEEVNAAIKRHIDPDKLSIYTVGDFAGKARTER